MYPSVKEVVAGKNYVLSVVFDNGEHGILDMKEIWKIKGSDLISSSYRLTSSYQGVQIIMMSSL